jgi:hypothetical protein
MYGDYTNNSCKSPEAKWHTRMLPLELLKNHSSILWGKKYGTLRFDWMELCGPSAPTLEMLLDSGSINSSMSGVRSGRFIGIDMQEIVIKDCKLKYNSVSNSSVEWYHGTLKSAILNHSNENLRNNVGVLVYDSHQSMIRKDTSNIRMCLNFAQDQYSKIGEFLLILNVVADHRWTSKSSCKEDYVKFLASYFSEKINVDDLLIYKSKVLPMAWIALRYGF